MYFSLSAQGPAVRDDPLVLVEVLAVLRREGLVEEGAVTLLTEHARKTSERLDVSALNTRLRELASVPSRAIEIRGLRTAEGFPNLFPQYTQDEQVLQAWITMRYVCTPPSERRFYLRFLDPEFLDDTPTCSAQRLVAQLNTLTGASLVPACFSQTPAEEA